MNSVAKVNNKVGHKLFENIFNNNTESSFAFSPYSINYVMYMAYQGFDGITKKEFEGVYGLDESENNKLFTDFVEFDKSIQHEELKSANAQFLEKTYRSSIIPSFIEKLKKSKFTFVISNFKENYDNERQIINTWVKNNTNGLIKDLLQEGTINPQTRVVLVNTLYLKMKWYIPFDFYGGDIFTRANNAVEKMVQREYMYLDNTSVRYFENEQFQTISIPYKSHLDAFKKNGYSFVIILPKNDDEFNKLYKYEDVANKFAIYTAYVKLPKFTTEFDLDLTSTYEELGLLTAFNEGECDFGNLTSKNDLFISAIIHKAKIIVDEEGTEAAATTAILCDEEFCMEFSEPDKKFIANHTFQYHIVHDDSNTVLFSGIYNGD